MKVQKKIQFLQRIINPLSAAGIYEIVVNNKITSIRRNLYQNRIHGTFSHPQKSLYYRLSERLAFVMMVMSTKTRVSLSKSVLLSGCWLCKDFYHFFYAWFYVPLIIWKKKKKQKMEMLVDIRNAYKLKCNYHNIYLGR